jgi:hypothetical protein
MDKLIELVDKVDTGVQINLIAEMNIYELGVHVAQWSRSPFSFPSGMPDQDIIDSLQQNQYAHYFE